MRAAASSDGMAPVDDMNTDTTGTCSGSRLLASTSAAATSAVGVVPVGMKITNTMSISSAAPRISSARPYAAGEADAIMSTGFEIPASAGRNSASSARVRSDRAGTSRPWDSSASAARIPGPPALVSTATLLPRGSPWLDSSVATSNSSSRVSVRITPVCRNSAATAVSPAEIAAVWLEAARTPAVVRPDFTATIGFCRDTRRAMRENLRGFPNDSRYIRITSVSGSSSQYCSRSLPEMSALLPTETNEESPSPSAPVSSMIASPSAPLWERNPTRPGSG